MYWRAFYNDINVLFIIPFQDKSNFTISLGVYLMLLTIKTI